MRSLIIYKSKRTSSFAAPFSSCLDINQRSCEKRSREGVDGVGEMGWIYYNSVFTDEIGAEAKRVYDALWNIGERAAIVRIAKHDLVWH